MHNLSVISNTESGSGMHHVICDAPAEIGQSFSKPGQFAILADGDQTGYFALAAVPGAKLEFLIKSESDLTQVLSQKAPGDTIQCEAILGDGFPMPASEPSNYQPHMHLFSMGSGIAPMRSLIQSYLQGGLKFSGLSLWQCSYTKEHLPFYNEYEDWSSHGVKIYLALDKTGPDRTGTLAEIINKLKPDFSKEFACWVGSKEFGNSLVSITAEYGLDQDRLVTNF